MGHIFSSSAAKVSVVKHAMGSVAMLCAFLACDSGNGPETPLVPNAPVLISPADSAVAVAISPALTWTASGGAASYTVQLSPSAAFDSAVITDSTVAQTAFAVTGFLANNTAYHWRVKAKNSAGVSAWSTVASFTTDIERVVMLSPNGGEIYHAGDTIPVSFEYQNRPNTNYFVSLWFSPDNGKSFDLPVLGAVYTVHWSSSPRKDTVWIIPTDTTIFGNYVTTQARIRVEDYTKKETENDVSDRSFAILSR